MCEVEGVIVLVKLGSFVISTLFFAHLLYVLFFELTCPISRPTSSFLGSFLPGCGLLVFLLS